MGVVKRCGQQFRNRLVKWTLNWGNSLWLVSDLLLLVLLPQLLNKWLQMRAVGRTLGWFLWDSLKLFPLLLALSWGRLYLKLFWWDIRLTQKWAGFLFYERFLNLLSMGLQTIVLPGAQLIIVVVYWGLDLSAHVWRAAITLERHWVWITKVVVISNWSILLRDLSWVSWVSTALN